MTRKEIEEHFTKMLLVRNHAHGIWSLPVYGRPVIIYSFSITHMPGRKEEEYLMIRISGGPVSLQGWYMPDAGIERIQKIIQEITRL